MRQQVFNKPSLLFIIYSWSRLKASASDSQLANTMKQLLHFISGYMSVCARVSENKPKIRNQNFDSWGLNSRKRPLRNDILGGHLREFQLYLRILTQRKILKHYLDRVYRREDKSSIPRQESARRPGFHGNCFLLDQV